MQIFGVDVLNVIVTAGLGALLYGFMDKAIKMLIMKNFPEKSIVKFVESLDDKYIDPYKKKFPDSVGELETKIADTLRQCANKIEDK